VFWILCGCFDSREKEVVSRMIGMIVRTLLKKLRLCCNKGRKQLWRGKSPYPKLFHNRFQFHPLFSLFFFVFTELCVLWLMGSLPKSRVTLISMKIILLEFNKITTPLRFCQTHLDSKHAFMSVYLVQLLKEIKLILEE
jgi:hypothetical protein